MKNSNTIATQFIKLIPRGEFNKLAEQYHSGQAIRKFTRFDQFVCLLTMQITARSSISIGMAVSIIRSHNLSLFVMHIFLLINKQ